MIRTFAAATFAAVVMISGAAFAASDTMEATFGNTVTVADASGNTLASYYMNADGTFSLTGADGTSANGTWRETDTDVCLTVEGTEEACSPLSAGHGVGDSWEATGADGASITLSITAGR